MPCLRRFLAASVALVVLSHAGASPAAPARTCERLAGSPVVTTPAIKVVRTGTSRSRQRAFYGCARPAGPIRLLGVTGDPRGVGELTSIVHVVRSAGPFVLYRRFVSPDGSGGTQDEARVVIDLRTGAKRTVWRFRYAESSLCEDPPREDYLPAPKQFVLGANGIVAGVYVPRPLFVGGTDLGSECLTPRDRSLVLASVPGSRRLIELDRAPVADLPATSLRLSGRTVTWRNAGRIRSRVLGPAGA